MILGNSSFAYYAMGDAPVEERAWNFIQTHATDILRRADVSARISQAVVETARLRQAALRANDTAKLATYENRLRQLAQLRARWQGRGASTDIEEIIREAEREAGPLGFLKNLPMLLVIGGAAYLALPFILKRAQGGKSF